MMPFLTVINDFGAQWDSNLGFKVQLTFAKQGLGSHTNSFTY